MTSVSAAKAPQSTALERHPVGLYILFATELWERFGFYTLLAIVTLYLQDTREGFGWTREQATTLWSNYLMIVYATPLIGGWIADKVLGYRRSVLIGGVVFALGYLLLTLGTVPTFYVALVLLFIGNGFFKPNISTMVGNLYPENSPLRDAAYTIFYMGINIGAFVAPVSAEALRQRFGFRSAFGAASAGLVLGTIIFWCCWKRLANAERTAKKDLAQIAELSEDLPPAPAPDKPAIEHVPEWKRIAALLTIYLIVIVFWMSFHQNGSTMTYWANDNTDWKSSSVIPWIIRILSLGTVDASQVSGVISNAINPFWIVVLSLPLVRFWGWLNKHGLEPSTPTKMALGMALTGVTFMILYAAAKSGGDTGRVSPWWLIGAYFVLSIAELMLSPMGLSLVSKVAPARMRGMMMGGWFVATAIGNKLTMIGVYWGKWSHSQFWLVVASLAFATAAVLFILIRPLKKAMPGV
jgi:POT family proton-dependent oligopeptide transporter